MFGPAMPMTGSYTIDFDLLNEPVHKQQLHQQLQMHQQQQHQHQPQPLQLQHQSQLQLHHQHQQQQHQHQQSLRFSDAVGVPASYSLSQSSFGSAEPHQVQSLHQQPQQHHLQLQQQQQQTQHFQPTMPVAFHQYAARGVGHPGFVGHLDSLYAIGQSAQTSADLQQHQQQPLQPPHHLLASSQHPQHLMQQQQQQQQLYQQSQLVHQCSVLGQTAVDASGIGEPDSDSSRDAVCFADDSAVGAAVNATPGASSNRSASSRRQGSRVPDDLKSDAYWKRRVRNNLSAKKSREKKRIDERQLAQQFSQLSEEVYADLLVYCALQRCRDLLGGPEMRRRRALERPPYLEEINRVLYYEGICYGLREAFRNKGLPMRALLPWRQACEDLNTWTDRRFIAFVGEQTAAGGQVQEESEDLQTHQVHQQQQLPPQTSAYFSVNLQMLNADQQHQSEGSDRLKYSPASAAAY